MVPVTLDIKNLPVEKMTLDTPDLEDVAKGKNIHLKLGPCFLVTSGGESYWVFNLDIPLTSIKIEKLF